jgi:hypothetical protein
LKEPLDTVHELYKMCVIKSNADAKEQEEKEKQEAQGNKNKTNKHDSPPSMSGVSMEDLEELLEEEM